MTHAIIEKRVLGSIIVSIFLSFIYLSIKEVQGSHAISLIFTAILIGTVMLEYLKPWYGFYLFLLFWPSMWIIGELLAKQGNPYWNVLPWDWPAPLTTAISLGCWLRFRAPNICQSNSEPLMLKANKPPKWFHFFHIALWGLLLSYAFSCATALWRMQHLPADWIVTSGALSTPINITLRYIPAILLGLLLLNHLAENSNRNACQIPHKKMIVFAVIGGIIAAIVFLYQRETGFTWAFNSGDPLAGPFSNKNTTAPFFVLTGILLLVVAQRLKWKYVPVFALSFMFLLLAILTQSRNSMFMILCLIFGVLLIRAGWGRLLLVGISLIIFIILLLWLPIPNSETSSIPLLLRLDTTVEELRTTGLISALGARWPLFKAALLIFKDYPLFGSGTGTFPMLTVEGARFGKFMEGVYMPSAHSMPLNLLAENGLLGMLSWSTAWIIIPLIGITRWHSGNVFALTIFVIGLGNIFDTVWMVPGMTTLCVLLIVWASYEELSYN